MNATSYCWSYIDFYTLITFILLTLIIMTKPSEQNSEAAAGGVLKNFANFTRKNLCWILFFTKLQSFRPATLLKRDTCTGVFLWNIEKFLRAPILKNICERLLLCMDYFIIYWFLQFATVHVFIFTNNFFFITQLKQ